MVLLDVFVATAFVLRGAPPIAWANGSAADVPAPVPVPPPGAAGATAPSDIAPPKATYVALGLAAAGVVAGTTFGIQALHDKRDFDRGDRSTQKVETIEKKALFADMCFGAAITFGVIGAALWWTREDGGPSPTARVPARGRTTLSRMDFAPLISPSATGATAVLRF